MIAIFIDRSDIFSQIITDFKRRLSQLYRITTFLIILQCAGKSITSLNDKIGKQGCVPYMHQTKMHNDTSNKILECRNIDLVYFLLGILYTLPDQNELEQIFQ